MHAKHNKAPKASQAGCQKTRKQKQNLTFCVGTLHSMVGVLTLCLQEVSMKRRAKGKTRDLYLTSAVAYTSACTSKYLEALEM